MKILQHWKILLLIMFTAALARKAVHEFKHADHHASTFTYSRVDVWIHSAECTQKSGTFLAGCSGTENLPIEDLSAGDDRGHALIGNLLGLVKTEPVTRTSFVRINLMIDIVGLIGMALMLRAIGLPLAALAFLGLTSIFFFPSKLMSSDVTAAYTGIFCLTLIPVLWFGSLLTRTYSRRKLTIGSTISVLSLFWALLLREPVGKTGLIVCLLAMAALAFRTFKERDQHFKKGQLLTLATLTTALIATNFGTAALLWSRNQMHAVAPPTLSSTHGAAHNIYIGLGTEPNSFGISWDDGISDRHAKREVPGVAYMSPLYFQTLWKLYFRILKEHPGEVARIYFQKALKVLNLPFYKKVALWHTLFLFGVGVLLIPALRSRFCSELHLPLMGILCLFYLQGVLALPDDSYLYAGKVGILLLFLLLLDRPKSHEAI